MQQPSKNYNLFTRWPEHRGDRNDVIYDPDGACEGPYGCVGGPRRANMGSGECVVMGLKSCNKYEFRTLNSGLLG